MSLSKHDIIKFRRGTAAEWAASEPQPGGEVLRLGEPGYEKDTGKLKIGDGVTSWNSLDYIAAGVIVIEDIDHLVNEVLQAGSGIALDFDDGNDSLTISTSGVSFDGHTHLSTDITDFNSGVSGLIPVKDIIDGIGTTVNSTDGIYSINVNASGITGTFDKISFNTTADPTIETGEIGWDAAEGTLDLGLENNVKIHIGEHTYFRIRNNTGSVLRSGQAVYASNVHNNILIEASPYTADGSIREIRFIGLVLEDVDINQKGYAINFGHIEQLDTRGNGSVNGAQNLYAADEPAWVEGDILYVHPTEPGKLTKVEPKHSISAAIVLYVHQNNGRIFVRPTSYGHLDDNHDVDLTNLEDNNFLVYNSGTQNWEPTNYFVYNEDTGQTTISTEGINNSLRLIQAADTGLPRINLIHNRGTLDSQTPLQSGDIIGSIYFSTINSSGINSICGNISAYTAEGLSSYSDVPTILRFSNRNKEGTNNNLYILEDGTLAASNGANISDNAVNNFFGPDRGQAVAIFNNANIGQNQSTQGSLSWCLGVASSGTTRSSIIGASSQAQSAIPSGTATASGVILGHNISAYRNALTGYDDNGTIGQLLGASINYGHLAYGSSTSSSTTFSYGLGITSYAGRGTIDTAYDIALFNTIYDQVVDASGTIVTGDGTITNKYGIVQINTAPNTLSGSLTVNNGLSAPTKITALGTVSGNVDISYDIDKQIQTLTLNGTATNFIEGSGWNIANKSVDVILEITVTSTTVVTWTIVDDQYNPFPNFYPGKYLVLLRSMGTTIQGHYIGVKTN